LHLRPSDVLGFKKTDLERYICDLYFLTERRKREVPVDVEKGTVREQILREYGMYM